MQAMYHFEGFTFFVKYDLESKTAEFTERRALGTGRADLKSGDKILIKDKLPGLEEAQAKLFDIIIDAMKSN